MQIETVATSKIQSLISKTDVLSCFLNSGDKEPCWDGHIYIHKDRKQTKEDIRKIATQIKGKQVDPSQVKDEIKYAVSYDDLKAYLMNGGALFFVVYIDRNTGEALQVYYASLLPIKIKDIIKKKQKSYRLSFKMFPNDTKKMVEIVIDAYEDAQRQASFAMADMPTIEELQKKGMIESLKFHFTQCTSEHSSWADTLKALEGRELTVYASVKGYPVEIPVEHYEKICKVTTSQDVEAQIKANGIKYYSKYRVIDNVEEHKLMIGSCVSIILPSKVSEQNVLVKINFKLKGGLSEQIRGLKFILSIAKSGNIDIDGNLIPVKKDFFSEDTIQGFNKRLSMLIGVQELLSKMNVAKDLDIDNLSKEDEKNLNTLIGSICERLPIRTCNAEENSLCEFKVSNLRLAVVYIRHIDGKVYLHDYFGEHFLVTQEDAGKQTRISQFAAMTANDFYQYDNYCFSTIIDDFKNLAFEPENVEIANCVMLEMIKAYDISGENSLIDDAEELNKWISQFVDVLGEEVIFLNASQIKIRKGKLDFDEQSKLYSIANNALNDLYRAGALILLGEVEKAEDVIDRLDEDEKASFKTLPIYTLIKNEKE